MYRLYVGNPNYSSWSLRAWVLMRALDIPFETVAVPVLGGGPSEIHRGYSGNGLVPCLHDGDFQVWDTLAIAETLAERHQGVWPADAHARARARSVSAEMHSGFSALRQAMPMNIGLELVGGQISKEVGADIDRIATVWRESMAEFGNGGDGYLFGEFCAADAMYAPVVWRFHTYNVELPTAAAAYRDRMLATPAMQQWADLARAEPTRIAHYEALAQQWGGPRQGRPE